MPKKLLLADDSVTVQRVIELTFADEGMDVVSVGDGAQAIESMDRERPDIVLADVTMPERDGYEVAEYVKTTPHLAHIPVVLMTGAFEQIDEARANLVKCSAVLAKPFEPHMVISLVHQLLRGEEPGGTQVLALEPKAVVPPVVAAHDDRGDASLDDYLDRIDVALAATTSAPAVRPMNVAAAAAAAGSSAALPSAPAPSSAARSPESPSLADAFSALLAEELGEMPLPASWGALAGTLVEGQPQHTPPSGAASQLPTISDALINEITRRVAERLTDNMIEDLVSRHVIEVAERLVREEIERIKSRS
jgi:CheY-like chemotaxis protein